MKLKKELTFYSGDINYVSGFINTGLMNIGLKEVGKSPQYSFISFQVKISSKSYANILEVMDTMKLDEWLQRIFENTMIIHTSEAHLFDSVSEIFKLYVVEEVTFEYFGRMVLEILEAKVSTNNCKAESISFIYRQ